MGGASSVWVLDSLAALFSAEHSMEAATASTTPAADARDRRKTGRQTQGSLAPSLVEETAADATVAGGRDKLLTRMMLGPGFLVLGTSWVEAATTTAAATVATSQPIPTLATTIPPTISSSVSATII